MEREDIKKRIEEMEDEECKLLIWLEMWRNASYEKLIMKHAELEMPLKRYSEGEEAYNRVREIIMEHFA